MDRKAEPLVEQIGQYFGSSEHMAVQQWEGFMALAKGEQDRAARLLYRAYEQASALDVPEQPSSIDPVLCMRWLASLKTTIKSACARVS